MRRAFSRAQLSGDVVRRRIEASPSLLVALLISGMAGLGPPNGCWAQGMTGEGIAQVPANPPSTTHARSSPCEERLTLGSDTLFEFEQADLSTEAELSLQVAGVLLQQKAGLHPVVIEGHTDGLGSDWYNDKLSEKRAQVVRDWLVERGFLRPDQVTIKAFGKRRPIAPNNNPDGSDNPDGRKQNRRVEIVVQVCD